MVVREKEAMLYCIISYYTLLSYSTILVQNKENRNKNQKIKIKIKEKEN